MPEPKENIGRYEIETLIGKGAMGRVYLAHDPQIERTVAIKLLRPFDTTDPTMQEARERFIREAKAAAKFDHENVIRIFDYGVDAIKGPYIVMEYIRGKDLASTIAAGESGDLKRKSSLALQMANALAHVHSHGVIHRDVKPENIRITESGKLKLMDFGIAKFGSDSLTQVGFTIGTPRYMAPEQIFGQAVTPATDVYSFGLVLYELITGRKAVAGDPLDISGRNLNVERAAIFPRSQRGSRANYPSSRPSNSRAPQIHRHGSPQAANTSLRDGAHPTGDAAFAV
jgi:serine/threonine-protein kinase